MPQMYMDRDFMLDTVFGVSIRFTKGEPVGVPPSIVPLARQFGAQLLDESDYVEPEPVKVKLPQDEVADPVERKRLAFKAFDQLTERNKRGDFDAANKPTIKAVNELVGVKLDAGERNAMWIEYNEKRAK